MYNVTCLPSLVFSGVRTSLSDWILAFPLAAPSRRPVRRLEFSIDEKVHRVLNSTWGITVLCILASHSFALFRFQIRISLDPGVRRHKICRGFAVHGFPQVVLQHPGSFP